MYKYFKNKTTIFNKHNFHKILDNAQIVPKCSMQCLFTITHSIFCPIVPQRCVQSRPFCSAASIPPVTPTSHSWLRLTRSIFVCLPPRPKTRQQKNLALTNTTRRRLMHPMFIACVRALFFEQKATTFYRHDARSRRLSGNSIRCRTRNTLRRCFRPVWLNDDRQCTKCGWHRDSNAKESAGRGHCWRTRRGICALYLNFFTS